MFEDDDYEPYDWKAFLHIRGKANFLEKALATEMFGFCLFDHMHEAIPRIATALEAITQRDIIVSGYKGGHVWVDFL